MGGDDPEELFAKLLDLLGGDEDIGSLALGAAEGLMDQNPRMRKGPIEAAIPVQIVATSGWTSCMVS